MTKAPLLDRAYEPIRLLSLDVVAGAVAGGKLAVTTLGIAGRIWPWYCVLGMAVWLVYTLDHLLDARRLGARATTRRHRFHHRHFASIGVVWLVVAVACLGLAVTQLPPAAIRFGFGLGLVVLAHLALVRWVGARVSPFLVKEAGVAAIYIVGIWGAPLLGAVGTAGAAGAMGAAGGALLSPEETSARSVIAWAVVSIHLLLALANLLELSLYEREQDEQDGQTSFVRAIGDRAAVRVVGVLLAAAGLLATGLLATGLLALGSVQALGAVGDLGGGVDLGVVGNLGAVGDLGAVPARQGLPPDVLVPVVLLAMTACLAMLLVDRGRWARHERYRAVADGAFLLPALLWVV